MNVNGSEVNGAAGSLALAFAKAAPEKRRAGLCIVRSCRRPAAKKSPLCSCHKMRIWRAENPLRAAFSNLRTNARKRGVVFALTLAEFEGFCERTGYLERAGREQRSDLQIDRIDHTQGYTLGNLQVLTLTENAAKGNQERRQGFGRSNVMTREEAALL